MNFCPNAFNCDVTDPRNIAYCREIQRQAGEACRVRENHMGIERVVEMVKA